jgi:cytochrome c2
MTWWRYLSRALALVGTLFTAGAAAAQEREAPGWADIDAGRVAFNLECRSCHSLKRGETVKGPSLAGVYGRRAGSEPTYDYSDQLKNAKIVWTEETLDTYLSNPFNMGTQVNMIIHGLRDQKMRTDLIAFLKHNAK